MEFYRNFEIILLPHLSTIYQLTYQVIGSAIKHLQPHVSISKRLWSHFRHQQSMLQHNSRSISMKKVLLYNSFCVNLLLPMQHYQKKVAFIIVCGKVIIIIKSYYKKKIYGSIHDSIAEQDMPNYSIFYVKFLKIVTLKFYFNSCTYRKEYMKIIYTSTLSDLRNQFLN